MIGARETMRSPEEIQKHIAQRRASLDAKIHELERRLSPREQVARVRSQLSPAPYLGLIAASAVAAGAAMAYRGMRRWHGGNGLAVDDPATAELMGE